MAGSVNRVILIGNLGKDPEVKYLDGGRGFAKFPIATSEVYRDKNGERKEQTEWHNIAVWRPGLVDVVEKYVKKGDKIFIEGKLRTRSWEDEDKNMRYMTEIVVDNLTMLGNRSDSEASRSSSSGNQSQPAQSASQPSPAPQPEASSTSMDDDDDLPF